MTSPIVRVRIHPHEYRDSMALMYFSVHLEKVPGVLQALAIMGTEANKKLLTDLHLSSPEVAEAGPNDLIVAVRATDAEAASMAMARLEKMLSERIIKAGPAEVFYHSMEGAVQALPGVNLAVISVPGRYAAREAHRALDLGMHVFLFSDNVPLGEEITLKQLGRDRGLLVMGPDCGTAIVGGIALGFGNVVRRGRIGIVGASGTGIQEVSVLLDRAGLGISHALGTGGRDLSAEVGGITTLQAIDLLEEDPQTEALAILSKLPAPEVAQRILARSQSCTKPVVACFLGKLQKEQHGNVYLVPTLAETAQTAASFLAENPDSVADLEPEDLRQVVRERSRLSSDQRFVRGLFSGGSLCEEAMVVWHSTIGPVWSNAPLNPAQALPDRLRSREHTSVDLGDDAFTAVRPHPMLDPSLRSERLLQEAEDPEVAVVVLDIMLGYGSHPDMAGALVPAIRQARKGAALRGRHLSFVAHVCGTQSDPQNLRAQEALLLEEGVLLAPSNAAAARLAALIARKDGNEGVLHAK